MLIPRKYTLVFLLSSVLLIAFVTVSLVNYRLTAQSVHTEIVSSSLPLMRENIYSEIQRDLTPPIYVASLMANDSFVRNWILSGESNLDAILQYLNEIRDEYGYFSTFLISSATGNYYHYTGILKEISPADAHDVWYYDFINSGERYDIDVDTNQAAGDMLTIFINYLMKDYSGNVLGVTGVGISMDNFSGFLRSTREKYNRLIFLVDRSGEIQAHPDPGFIKRDNIHDMTGISAIADTLLTAGDEPVDGTFSSQGQHILVTSRYVPEVDWYLIVEQNEHAALTVARTALWRTILIGLGTSLFIIAISGAAVRRYQTRLERIASTDELTGVYNRREFNKRFQAAASRFARYKTPLSLVILDIDRFKRINDTLGHPTGDGVLVSVARLVAANIRPGDSIARWGGDEFALLLECGIDEATVTAQRLRETVENGPLDDVKGAAHPVTISLGVALYGENDTVEALTVKADKALYVSKDRGRNRVTVYTGDETDTAAM